MAYARAIRFEPGETLIACSICGFPYLFPSQLTYCDDRLFRCKRTCMEQTKRANDRQQVQSQKRRDHDRPIVGGAGPGWSLGINPPGSPVLWYDASDIDLSDNQTLHDGDSVATWKNKGSLGSAADLLQATPAAKPTFRLFSSTGKVNDRPSVSFSGSNWIQSGNFTAVAQPNMTAMVVRYTSGVIFSDGNDVTNRQMVYATTGVWTLNAGSPASSSVAPRASYYQQLVVGFNGASTTLRVDKASVTIGNPGASGIDGVTLGGNYAGAAGWFLVGDILSHLTWAGTLPTVAQVEAYFDSRLTTSTWPNQ